MTLQHLRMIVGASLLYVMKRLTLCYEFGASEQDLIANTISSAHKFKEVKDVKNVKMIRS